MALKSKILKASINQKLKITKKNSRGSKTCNSLVHKSLEGAHTSLSLVRIVYIGNSGRLCFISFLQIGHSLLQEFG